VTTSDTARGWDINLDVDQTRLKLINNEIEQSLEGTVGDPVPEFIGHGIGALGIPSVGIIYDFNPPNEFEKDLQVGLRQLVFNFIFEPIGEFSEGETLPVHIARGGWTHDPERITAVAVHPDVLIDGTIHFGSSGLERVKNLQVDVETETAPVNKGAGLPPKIKSVRLSWENGDLYDHLLVERNGETVAQIPGDSTSYVDMEVPNAVFTYKIFGASGARSSFPAATLVSTFSPPGTFLRGDATFDDNVDVSDSIKILRFLFLGGEVLQCEDAADVDDSGILDTTDPIFLLSYLFLAGSPIQAPVGPFPWFDPTPDDLPCGQ
jgi:hypothetical protein